MIKRSGRTVGILGGMGAAAGANFLSLFVQELQRRGAHGDTDFPRMLFYGLPLDDFGVSGAENKAEVRRQVCAGVEWLLDKGAEVVAVPCNSVHEFYPFGAERQKVLDIVEETLIRTSSTRLGILCSTQTREARLYELEGLECCYGNQTVVDSVISSVMAGEAATLGGLLGAFVTRDFFPDQIVLGCTELSLCDREGRGDVVDSAQCLAEALADWMG